MVRNVVINKDCKFFRGSKPCVWNKSKGYECATCGEYRPRGTEVLIIKLDAIGDVLRSTCIVPKIKEKAAASYLTWITKPESMQLLSASPDIDEVWNSDDTETLSRLQAQKWDFVYSLDNTYASSALASLAKATKKVGFLLTDEGITPTNDAALNWLQMAVFDRIKKENTKSYQEIMYEICDFSPPISKPCLHVPEEQQTSAEALTREAFPHRAIQQPIVGINTGSGSRWPKKMLGTAEIVAVIKSLRAERPDCYVLLLGGPNEAAKNEEIVRGVSSAQVEDIGCDHTLVEFAAIVGRCNALLCGDTLALHIAAALDVPTVAVFGPTSFSEIYDYSGLIEKVRTDELDCLCCYGDCDKEKHCMAVLSADLLTEKVFRQINKNNKSHHYKRT